MIRKLITAAIVAGILYLIWYLIGLVVASMGLPAVVMLIVGVLLVLAFIGYVLNLFGIVI